MAVDPAGNAYVTGATTSANFPVQNPLQRTLKGNINQSNAFVSKFGPSGVLLYSTYLGASYTGGTFGDSGNSIAADAQGNAYVAGQTASAQFPVMNPLQPYKGIISGVASGFVSKIVSDGSSLAYSTFLGGSYSDYVTGIAVDGAGNAYVTGTTSSPDFPITTSISPPLVRDFSSAFDKDAFVTKINPAGSALVYSTFLGGKSGDVNQTTLGVGIAVDAQGNAYVAGNTNVADFPTVKPLYTLGSSFVSKVNAAGSALALSTFLPGCELTAIAIDAGGDVFVTGSSSRSAVSGFPLSNAIQPEFQGNQDAILTAFAADGSALLYSTYLGAEASGTAIAADAAGNVYVTGTGQDLPKSSQAFQPVPKGSPDSFVFAYSTASSPSTNTVNAASFATGTPIAPGSIATVFGSHLGTQTAQSPATLGTTLGGSTVNLTDASGHTIAAGLFYVSPTQINFLVPSTLVSGTGQIEVTAADGVRSVGVLRIADVGPGIFTADGTLAVGTALTVDAGGNQTNQSLVQYDTASGKLVPVPIALNPSSSTYLVLYGTGIHNAPLSQITITVGGQSVPPLYAGMQGQFVGEDQINFQLPNSLAGAGDVAITLTAGESPSNTVHVNIQ